MLVSVVQGQDLVSWTLCSDLLVDADAPSAPLIGGRGRAGFDGETRFIFLLGR